MATEAAASDMAEGVWLWEEAMEEEEVEWCTEEVWAEVPGPW